MILPVKESFLGLSEDCRGGVYLWGYFLYEVQKIPPHFLFATEIPKAPFFRDLYQE